MARDKANKLTKGEEPSIEEHQAKHRRDKGVEIRPEGKGDENKKY